MTRLYLLFGIVAAFDLSIELGYLSLAVIAVHIIHKAMHKIHKEGIK